MSAADQVGWVVAAVSGVKHLVDYVRSRNARSVGEAKAEAAQTSAEAELQQAVNRAVQLALKTYEEQIDRLRAELVEARAELAQARAELVSARTQLETWESASKVVNETLEHKQEHEAELREQLVLLEAERDEKAIEAAKARGELDRLHNLLVQARGPDFAPRANGCPCQWELGDLPCTVHPTCEECGEGYEAHTRECPAQNGGAK